MKKTIMTTSIILALAGLGLAGCDDSSKVSEARTAPKQSTNTGSVVQNTENGAKNMGNAAIVKTDDAAITTAVNAKLVADPELSALKINVDTKAGHVSLMGNAPNAASAARATDLVKGVANVVSVDNKLVINPNGPNSGVMPSASTQSSMDNAANKTENALNTAAEKTGNALETAGEKVGSAMETAGQKISNAADRAQNSDTLNKVETRIDDAAITTAVNAKLVGDSDLSALKINVDTKAGMVWLKGSAPSDTAKMRATELAQAVEGVRGVENNLEVVPK